LARVVRKLLGDGDPMICIVELPTEEQEPCFVSLDTHTARIAFGGAPSVVSVAVSRDGVLLAGEELRPVYEVREGPCGSECHRASASVLLE
jgi:hypothetical protein